MDVMRGYLYEGHRRNAVSAVLSHIGWRWGDEALCPVAAFLYQDEFRLFAGREGNREIRVLNDTLTDDTVHAIATITSINGIQLTQMKKSFKLEAGAMASWKIKIPPFYFKGPRYVYLTLEARSEKTGYYYRKPIRMTVMGECKPDAKITNAIGLFDPDGKTDATLSASGFKLRRISSLDEDALKKIDVLVIGNNGLANADKAALIINERAVAGLKVLVLRQSKLIYSFPFPLEDGDNVSDGAGAVIADLGHPVFAGLGPEDLRFFQNAERVPLVYRNAPFIPAAGGVKCLLTGSRTQFPKGTEFAPLFQYRCGKGLFMVSQLALTDSLAYDPVAGKLLANMLSFLASYKKGEGRLGLALDRESEMRLKTRRGLDTTNAGFTPNTKALFVSRGADTPAGNIKGFVNAGGTLYLKGLTPAKIAMLQKAFGLKVKLRAHKSPEALMRVRDPLFAGLTQMNWIFWRAFKGAGTYQGAMDVGREVILVDSPGATPLLEPAYIVRVPVGKGHVILDTSRWGEVNLKRAQLITLAILGNLGAEFVAVGKDKGRDWKKVAAQFDFHPLDVSMAVNRGFIDKNAGDGKGGWTDEGAVKGLHGFPVGAARFNEIPFNIADPAKTSGRGLLALRGHSWANAPAKSREIPVGRKLDKLFLIHGCAWAILPDGAEMARYIIHYADRKDWIPGNPLPFVHVPVLNKRHIYDWWFYDKIASGEYKMPDAFIAWRGAGSRKNQGVAMMEWTNPYPERVIDAIQVEATTPKSQFFFIGATGATFKAEARRKVMPKKLTRDNFPAQLKGFKRKNLWKLSTDRFNIYLDSAQRIRLVTTLKGKPLLDECGYWHFHTLHGKKFKHGDHQSGDFINRSRIYRDADGSLVIELTNIERKMLSWSQKIIVNGPSFKIINELVLNDEFRMHVADGKPSISTSVSVYDKAIKAGGKPVTEENGLMVLPGQGFTVTCRFNDKFKRYKGGVSYFEKHATCRIAPDGFSMETFKPGIKYKMEIVAEITGN